MPRESKYYGTLISSPNFGFIKKYPNSHNQFRLVVKAKSFTEANRVSEVFIGYKPFVKRYTSETGNVLEIELCEKFGGAIICIDGNRGKNFISLEEAMSIKSE